MSRISRHTLSTQPGAPTLPNVLGSRCCDFCATASRASSPAILRNSSSIPPDLTRTRKRKIITHEKEL